MGQSWCYSHNPEGQEGKPLLPVLKTMVCRGQGLNPRAPAHEADSLTTRRPRRSDICLQEMPKIGTKKKKKKHINSLPNNKVWVLTNKFDVAKMMISLFDRAKNIEGKGENASYQHFLLFPQCFPKASYSGSLKVVMCGKELTIYAK